MKKDNTEQKLRQLLGDTLPQAPANPWFTRMVMNRLPDKIVRYVAIAEYILYITGIAATVMTAINLYNEISCSDAITVGHILEGLLLMGLFGTLLYAIAVPFTEAHVRR